MLLPLYILFFVFSLCQNPWKGRGINSIWEKIIYVCVYELPYRVYKELPQIKKKKEEYPIKNNESFKQVSLKRISQNDLNYMER